MAASITAHLQIFKRTQLPHFSTDFIEIGIKIHGLQSSFLLNILIIRVAVPFNFPFLDGDVPGRPSYGVYISQLIRFARAFSHVIDINNRNKFLTAKLLK